MVRDPICGMVVDERETPFHTYWEHANTFYFCSEHCKIIFDEGPDAKEMEKMSWWKRLIKRLGEASAKRYGGKPPSCH
jgi:YHS domain-containing protein